MMWINSEKYINSLTFTMFNCIIKKYYEFETRGVKQNDRGPVFVKALWQ